MALFVGYANPYPMPPWLLFVTTLAAGLLVAAAWYGSDLVITAIAAIVGTFIGLDSPPDDAVARTAWLALAGTWIGMSLLVIYAAGLAIWFARPWQRIAIRAAGSWISASALLILAFEIFAPARP